jgi:hypothetical protein
VFKRVLEAKKLKLPMSSDKQVSTPDFSDAVLQSALAHLLKSVSVDADTSDKQHSFQSVEYGVMSAFSDIVGKYIETVGMASAENGAVAGRSQANLYDLINALETTHSPPVTVEDLYDFAASNELNSWLDRRVPDFPVCKRARTSKFGGIVESRKGTAKHILPFMPPYPPIHTYVHNAVDAVTRAPPENGLKTNETRALQHSDLRESMAVLGKEKSGEKKVEMANPFLRPPQAATAAAATTTGSRIDATAQDTASSSGQKKKKMTEAPDLF